MTGLLLLDKPVGITSQQAVRRVQRMTDSRRAGHGGTLDPLAEGLLPILIGSATRLSRFFLEGDKSYTADLMFGRVTDTQDITGNTLETHPVNLHRNLIDEVIAGFLGEVSQLPPMFSALSVGGKRLYKLARQGVEVERDPRTVTIHAISLLDFDGFRARLSVTCSKGTYIRTLIHDIGQKLGCGACMSGLRRTSTGDFSVADAVTFDTLDQAVADGTVLNHIRAPESLFMDLPVLSPPPFFVKLLKDGQRVQQHKLGSTLAPGEMARLYAEGAFFGLLGETQTADGTAVALIWRV